MTSLSANPWALAARPRTLPAAVAPVITGSALAFGDGKFNFIVALACLVGAVALQIGANYANDLSDFSRGADTPDRLGPTRVTATGLLSPRKVQVGAAIAFAVATLVGIYLILVAGWPILAIGVSALIAAVTYVGGPLPYGYRGLGEVFVFIFFGLAAVVGTYFAQSQMTAPSVWAAASALGFSASAVLVVNNIRDRVTDLKAGKRTLVAVWGRSFGNWLYAICLGGSIVALVICADLRTNFPLGLFSLALAYSALRLVQEVFRTDGESLNPLLGATAKFGLELAVIATIAIGIEIYLPYR